MAGMNDKEEVSYVDKYIYGNSYVPTSSMLYNEKFILSCTTFESFDNLTLYRLYADDAKGVCVQYEININPSPDFYIKTVEYSDKQGHNQTLDAIRSICEVIWKKTSFRFDFFGNSGWKYFFKPYDYFVENEVRLLFSRKPNTTIKRGWVITYQNNIVNPYIEFDLGINNSPPLYIKKIVLGPKHPEKAVNIKQYKDLVDDHKNRLGVIDVDVSAITSYR